MRKMAGQSILHIVCVCINRIGTLRTYIISAVTVGLILGAWHVTAEIGVYPDFIAPSPTKVLTSFLLILEEGYAGESLGQHFAITLIRAGVAFILASVTGTILGLSMGMSPLVRATFGPFVEFIRPMPPLAYLSLLIIWIGIGELSKITVLYLAALPPVVINTASAVKSVRIERINGARSLGANDWEMFRYIIFPSCLPEIFAGIRVAFGLAYITIVAAEMIAANSGLGWSIMHAQRFLRTDVIFIVIFLMAFTGIALEQLLRWVEAKVVPWAGKA